MFLYAHCVQRMILTVMVVPCLLGLAPRSALATPITVSFRFDLASLDHTQAAGSIVGEFTGDPGSNNSLSINEGIAADATDTLTHIQVEWFSKLPPPDFVLPSPSFT